jgi:hypothetical protein
MKIHRVRTIDIDGGRIGTTWNSYYFIKKEDADSKLKKEIERIQRNSFLKVEPIKQIVDEIEGYSLWRNTTTMVTQDIVEVKE